MFLFRNYNVVNKVSPKPEKTTDTIEDFVVDSVYVIMVNGEPACYKKSKLDVFTKVDEIINKFKIKSTLDNKEVYEEYDYDGNSCKIFSKGKNNIINYDNLEFKITWKKVSNF